MKNLEQNLAKTLLEQFKSYERMTESQKQNPFHVGQKIALEGIAIAVLGIDITGEVITSDLIESLEKIANKG